MLDVHLVLYQLDDGQDEVGVTQPTEHVIEDGHILVLYALGDAVREGRQYHTGNVRGTLFDVAGYGKGVVVGITRHTDNQVDVSGFQYTARFLGC